MKEHRPTPARVRYAVPLNDWIEQCFTSPPTQYRLYGRLFLQVKRPNQQYQSTEGTCSTQTNQIYNKQTWTQNTASPLVYNNMGWLGDVSHRGQVRHAWTAVDCRLGTPVPLNERKKEFVRRKTRYRASFEIKITSLMTAACFCAGKVDAYIRLQLDPSEVEECEDEMGRNIFLYPGQDLHIKPYMNAQIGFTG